MAPRADTSSGSHRLGKYNAPKPLAAPNGFGCVTALHMAHLLFATFLQFGFLLTKVGL